MLELLNQLDGFEESQNIKIIIATNRNDILDDARLEELNFTITFTIISILYYK